MQMSFRVTVWVGARTKTSVDAHSQAVNKKVVTLKNGAELSDTEIARWLETSLLDAINKLEYLEEDVKALRTELQEQDD